MGFTRIYWAVLRCTGQNWAVLVCNGLYLSLPGLYWALLGCPGGPCEPGGSGGKGVPYVPGGLRGQVCRGKKSGQMARMVQVV